MQIFDELKKRGIIAQTTNEDKIKYLIDNGKLVFYLGCDPTADSLHAGHLIQLMLMSRLQRHGHSAICLLGGGTGFIGDPSGKNSMRKLMQKEQIEHNVKCFQKQMSKFLDVLSVRFVNNADWLCNLNYIEFLREIGVFFNVNKMLAAECYKQRLDEGLTFLELNYMIMQGYDFLYLHNELGCNLQIGGNDQWSNMIAGVELIRKKTQDEAFGLTTNLLTNSEGKKMGKTANGALWLDPEKTSPYEFYQYWRNVADSDVINCVKLLTEIDLSTISEFEKLQGQQVNEVKEILAFEVTKTVHGKSEAEKVREISKQIFVSGNSSTDIPVKYVNSTDIDVEVSIVDLIFKAGLVPSKSEARRLIEQQGISVDGKVSSLDCIISKDLLKSGVIVKKGKKTYVRVCLKD